MSDPSQPRRRRRSSLSTAAETVKAVSSAASQSLLVLWDDLPSWRRDNAFIRSGYRAESNSYAGSFRSLGWLHNESVNIWSHLLGAVCFFVTGVYLHTLVAPRYASASGSDVLVFAAFFSGAFCCLGMSATYHALCNHSPAVARWGNKLDYTGIVFLIVGSYVPALYYGMFCRPGLMTVYLYMVSLAVPRDERLGSDLTSASREERRRISLTHAPRQISLLGLGCLVVSWFDHFRTPEWRPYRALMFVGLGVSGVVPVIHGMRLYGLEHMNQRMGLSWVLLQGFLYILGAFIYAASLLPLGSCWGARAADRRRSGGRSASCPGGSTSGAAPTRYSTSSCFSQPPRTCTVWPRRSISTTVLLPAWSAVCPPETLCTRGRNSVTKSASPSEGRHSPADRPFLSRPWPKAEQF